MKVKRFYCILWLLMVVVTTTMAQKLTGVVIDKNTGDSIPMASAIYRGHKVMTVATVDGGFTIARHNGWVLTFSAIGYTSQNITISSKTPQRLVVKMVPSAKQLDNVVIKAKKEKYSRKNNPAVELMKRVIAAKKRTNLLNHDYYQFTKYQKLSMSLNDYKPKIDSITHKPTLWSSQAEISPLNNKWVLPVSVDETVTQHFYRKDPLKERDIIQGEQSSGINQLLVTGDMVNIALKDLVQDIDIYDEYVRLVQHPFLSPIADGAISFYRYYIIDTLKVENDSCFHLHFLPNNQQDFGFRGDLYILKDSTLHVKKCELSVPKSTGVNFVRSMHSSQVYTKIKVPVFQKVPQTATVTKRSRKSKGDDVQVVDSVEEWVLTQDDMWAEATILTKSLLVVRDTRLTDYEFSPIHKSIFRGKGTVKRVAIARNRDDEFWDKYRTVELTEKESNVSSFMETLKRSKGMRIPLFIVRTLLENYIETGKPGNPSKFDFGPFMSTFSSNFVDGFRTRISGHTTPSLNPHWFTEGYVTYGFGSGRVYYDILAAYHFNKKKKTFIEFPVRSIVFESQYDVENPSDRFLSNSKDNMLASIKTESIQQLYLKHSQTLTFTYETDWNFCFKTHLRTESIIPKGYDVKDDPEKKPFNFTTPGMFGTKFCGTTLDYYRNTEWKVDIKYAPGQTLINTKQMRIPVNRDAPEYYFKHTVGILTYLGKNHISNLTEVSVYKRQWLGSWGHIDLRAGAAIQWNKVPFTALMTPEICLTYIEQPGTFNMLHNMEFFADRKVSFSAVWNMNGKIFNRIPLFKKLKFREFIGFRAVWGDLTDKNNPALNPNDKTLFVLPSRSKPMTGGEPYMEATVGIHNILKFFCVDYVRRINYLDDGATADGVRFGLEFTF